MAWRWVGLGILSIVFPASCATNIMTVPSPVAQIAAPPMAQQASATQPVTLQLVVAPEDDRARAGAALVEAIAPVEGTAIFFETGQAHLSPDGKVKLLRIADVLRRYPDLKVRVEGNADERGPADYNLELGLRRARAAKEFLIAVKVKPDQVILRTNGAEKPLAPGHDEASWEVNRRSDVNLVKDKPADETTPAQATDPAAEEKK